MVNYNQSKNTDSALKTRNHQAELEEDPINITYGILDQIFKVLGDKDISAMQLIQCLATTSKKSENIIMKIVKKHNFVKKTKNYLKKPK